MWLPILLLIALALVAAIYFFISSRKSSNFWKKHGVPQIDTYPSGFTLDVLIGRKGLFELDDHVYKEMGATEKFCGLMEMGRPLILIKDLDLVKKVLIKDFEYFVDRRKVFQDYDGLMSKTLVNLEGDMWKGVRASISPTFTTGKIRRMMQVFNSVGLEWVTEFRNQCQRSSEGHLKLEMMKAVNRYTVDVIGSAVFGMNTGTIKNPDSEFNRKLEQVLKANVAQFLKIGMRLAFPRISEYFRIQLLNKDALQYFEDILTQGFHARKTGKVPERNDFLQLLVEAQKGELKAIGRDELDDFEKEAMINVNKVKGQQNHYLDDDTLNAQSILFFIAGFNTTSSLVTFTLYVLAAHQDIQERLREEVKKIIREDGGVNYDDISGLAYLEMVINEVHRKWPAGPRLERMCVKEFHDPETGLFVPKGALLSVPARSIHEDPRYWENPEKFDPEHFSPKQKSKRSPYAFLPFGIGPRNCIGMRFAVIETKVAIAHIVHNFKIEPTEKTPLPVRSQPFGFNMVPPKGLELKLTPVNYLIN